MDCVSYLNDIPEDDVRVTVSSHLSALSIRNSFMFVVHLSPLSPQWYYVNPEDHVQGYFASKSY